MLCYKKTGNRLCFRIASLRTYRKLTLQLIFLLDLMLWGWEKDL